MSRIVTGKLRLDLRSVELAGVIEAAVDAVRPAADARGVSVLTTSDAGVPPVLGDADRLQQAIWNLLTNAIKFTPRGGRVQVELRRREGQAEVVVSDTGIGIAAEFLPFIFDRFRQADATCTRSSTGLGLGLSIVKHVVEAHGGTVDAASGGPDHGATFRLVLPLPADDQPHATPSRAREMAVAAAGAAEPPAVERLRGLRVLAIDDETDSLSLLVTVLSAAGAEVVGEASGAAGLARLDAWAADVVVTDIGMPGMDGWELVRRLRERSDAAGGRMPVAALTAYARSEDRARALREGFDIHVAKPVDPGELVAAIAALAGRATPQPRPLDVY
jgi:CheY-like chemotaxis protein